ncbi:hypothetical protein [Pseudomonas sp. TTU2014-080ASC]|uniref:hypothetical protein n=1 Tax=Pseudomonas sp. TTU2014-080ASC TaxID=1729724 RepID=UPI000AFA4EC5|nr:hypothetical protein [Pseudomonas sp. TTU2014-080ASC]
MNRILVSETSAAWTDHILERISAAEGIGLLASSDKLKLDQAIIIFPDNADFSLIAKSNPGDSINELLDIRQDVSGKWVERVECLEDAARLIQDLCAEKKQAFMLCEAGYSKVGDKFLENHDYTLLAGNPIFLADIRKATPIEIAKTLRAGRSTRILGVIKSEVSNRENLKGRKEFFLCDALDGDSIIICPLAEA